VNRSKWTLVVVLCVLLVPAVAGAQGSIAGVVKDSSGATTIKTFNITINAALAIGSLSTTQAYTEVDRERLLKVYDLAHPRA